MEHSSSSSSVGGRYAGALPRGDNDVSIGRYSYAQRCRFLLSSSWYDTLVSDFPLHRVMALKVLTGRLAKEKEGGLIDAEFFGINV